jgi:5,10-methylenetetrahydrofolate reductase
MTASPFLEALSRPGPLCAVELRPPSAALEPGAAMEAWIDAHHGLGRLLAQGRFVLLTDGATGSAEEESLAHLAGNLGPEADLSRVVPFLTCRHTLDYCLLFARRAGALGLGGLTVTGGDAQSGVPRCLPRSSELRRRIHRSNGGAPPLGMWVNPFRDAEAQVRLVRDAEDPVAYFATQVVSHHDLAPVDRFLEAAARQGLEVPGVFGVFHYRSANPRTLARLAEFLPVPAEGLTREFHDEGAPAEEVTARTIRALRVRGVEKVYVSNVAVSRAAGVLARVEGRV